MLAYLVMCDLTHHRTITSSYYRGAHGIIVVYDVTDRGELFALFHRPATSDHAF